MHGRSSRSLLPWLQLDGTGEPALLLPGDFERKLARRLQVDGVFMRPIAPADAWSGGA